MCLTLCDPTRFLCPWDYPDKNTGAGCHFLLQGIFSTQGLNPNLIHLLHWQAQYSCFKLKSDCSHLNCNIWILWTHPSCKKSAFLLSSSFAVLNLTYSLINSRKSHRANQKCSCNTCFSTEISTYMYFSIAALLMFVALKSLQRGRSPLICFLSMLGSHLAWDVSLWCIIELQNTQFAPTMLCSLTI